MRSGEGSRRVELALVAVAAAAMALAATAPGAGAQERSGLARLLDAMSGMEGLSTRFTETKRIALLAAPLESEGEIHFAPPDRLVRRVTSPSRSTVLLEGDRLVMAQDGRREEIDLSERPVVAAFVGSFRHVLRGDRQALERTYRIHFEEADDGWRLVLRPRDATLRRFLTSLALRGEGDTIHSMRMVEQSGDVTETRFHDVRPDRRFPPAELRRLFRVP